MSSLIGTGSGGRHRSLPPSPTDTSAAFSNGAGAASGDRPSSAIPINILIVDDEPKNLTVLETILDDPSYRLVRAETAEQALIALLENEFALLILDVRMPGMTGFELAKIIKARKKNAGIPIIFLTAYYNEDQHVVEGYDTGAVDYLHKPVNASVLKSKVAIFADIFCKQRDLEFLNRSLLTEIDSRRRAEEQLRDLNGTLEQRVLDRTQHISLLMREVDHRSKNILALVQSIARQTVTTRPDNFMDRFSQRLQALAASHDLLVKSQWQGTDIKDVIMAQLAHLGDLVGERVALHGEAIKLTSAAAQVLGMAAHELATNACKYGALLNGTGQVDIGWQIVGDTLTVDWVESGGPAVEHPKRRGMGSKVIETVTAMSLDGNATLTFAQSGVIWHLDCPVERVSENIALGGTPAAPND